MCDSDDDYSIYQNVSKVDLNSFYHDKQRNASGTTIPLPEWANAMLELSVTDSKS